MTKKLPFPVNLPAVARLICVQPRQVRIFMLMKTGRMRICEAPYAAIHHKNHIVWIK